MKTAIILHGKPDKEEYMSLDNPSQSNRHWIPWLQKQLAINGILPQALEMPRPFEPVYEEWANVFERFDVNEDTTLVGHSCGGGFLVRWLSEHKVRAGKVVLVAPWIDPNKTIASGFFDFEIDSELISRTQSVTVMYSTDDDESILKTVATLKEKLPNAVFMEFTDKGHFCSEDLVNNEFPELRDVILA